MPKKRRLGSHPGRRAYGKEIDRHSTAYTKPRRVKRTETRWEERQQQSRQITHIRSPALPEAPEDDAQRGGN
ncbi:hypothetical protein NITHO_3400003 [Nitrolancea hollandica Lb]|uniref:Uncharacterized protein n=1 Tax=Nitrolancea hollandica Lb TaxID=1129897 RepID=I4EIA7_9BACT|nr:hypothetical protein NITHO_3400003 [Nitrolancea hollandica Lb]